LVIDQKARILHDFFEFVLAGFLAVPLAAMSEPSNKARIQGKHSIK